jgi:hypothetical protein
MRADLPAPAHRRGPTIVAALAVAAVAVGFAAVSFSDGSAPDDGPAATMTSSSQPDGDGDVLELDHGPSDDQAAVAACAGDGFADDPADVEVLYDVLQESPDGTTPVLLLRNADRELRLCDMTGPDAPATLPLPQADHDEPVVELTNNDRVWSCDADVLTGFRATTWLSTAPEVAEVAQRFVVDGTPGPWFSSTPVDGVAHLQSWLRFDQVPQQADAVIHLEQRARQADGTAVDSGWAGRQRIAGCTGDGGEVQIG